MSLESSEFRLVALRGGSGVSGVKGFRRVLGVCGYDCFESSEWVDSRTPTRGAKISANTIVQDSSSTIMVRSTSITSQLRSDWSLSWSLEKQYQPTKKCSDSDIPAPADLKEVCLPVCDGADDDLSWTLSPEALSLEEYIGIMDKKTETTGTVGIITFS